MNRDSPAPLCQNDRYETTLKMESLAVTINCRFQCQSSLFLHLS